MIFALSCYRNLNKVRVIALYILHRDGVPDEDRRRLYQHARLSIAEQDAVNALVYLGIRISRGPNDRDIKRKIKQKPAQDEEYDLSRYKPLLRTMLEVITLFPRVNSIDFSTYVFCRNMFLGSSTKLSSPTSKILLSQLHPPLLR